MPSSTRAVSRFRRRVRRSPTTSFPPLLRATLLLRPFPFGFMPPPGGPSLPTTPRALGASSGPSGPRSFALGTTRCPLRSWSCSHGSPGPQAVRQKRPQRLPVDSSCASAVFSAVVLLRRVQLAGRGPPVRSTLGMREALPMSRRHDDVRRDLVRLGGTLGVRSPAVSPPPLRPPVPVARSLRRLGSRTVSSDRRLLASLREAASRSLGSGADPAAVRALADRWYDPRRSEPPPLETPVQRWDREAMERRAREDLRRRRGLS